MRSPRLWAALCLLLTASCRLCAAARHGCLFEKKLCSRDQLCRDDGLFGQCVDPHQEPVQYQVSVAVLHKLQEVLKDLMSQGLTWRDDVTQAIISRELSHVPAVEKTPKQLSKLPGPSQWKVRGPEDRTDVDYMVLDPSRSSMHMQASMLDPYTYRQFGYQNEEERSLNSLDNNPAFPPYAALSRGNPLDQHRQLIQDLVSLYLTSPSSSSSPVQPLSRQRGALAAAAAAGSTSSSSSSSYFPDLDFPLDYSDDYVSQMSQLRKQQQLEQAEKKAQKEAQKETQKETQKEMNSLSGLDEPSLQRLAVLLDHYGQDMDDIKNVSPKQKDDVPAALKQLQLESSYSHKQLKDKYGNKAGAGKKMVTLEAPPSTFKSSETETTAKQATPTARAGQNDPAAEAEGYGYIVTNQSPLSLNDGVRLLELLSERVGLSTSSIINLSVVGPVITFRIRPNSKNLTAGDVAQAAVAEKNFLESETGLKVEKSGVGERNDGKVLPLATRVQPGSRWLFATLVAMACIGSILVAAMTITCLRHHAHRLAAKKLGLGPEGGAFSHQEYQDLCRQHMASKGAFGRLEAAALGAVGGAAGGGSGAAGVGSAGAAGGADSRVSSVSSQFSDGAQPSPSSHSSTPSWCEEPAQANMDISTGHMILAYMEDHLRNKDRLMKEWEALCSYQAEPSAVSVAQTDANTKKNRCPDSVPYDHSRVKLKADVNPSRSDYINASTIIEHDPRMPAYIATQGPLSHTISDFWQMVWENGCTVIVMMTALVEDGEKQCDRYWPDEGSSLYHIYEVNLVSEHIWCNDFLVRSFYLKNVQTQETRTLTQFHFLSWPAQGIPPSTRPLLDFRRKVNKCYRGRSCPIIVHCSDGTGRTGTYILIDMVLNRMAKGVKEIDIAATLEHVRDQRPGMVRTKDQFEFALTAVAEEVNAILKALPQ
ncbi:receptor-type tyrosine-protein phosphatase-like N isoform X2 [Echeneis naucrates]|uniref:receptor-type tyrosine-protein phosphatase-like N isoform X2 n=1 Tax=Echeneis naucrates TaxID=173247 RepID=UPI001113D87B|nr:receptor-type tyrosine-protein phosphatase-like N isoform X2 [Echeneis naucrates]